MRLGSFDTTFGAVYGYGAGDILVSNELSTNATLENAQATVDLTSHTLLFVLSGAVTVEEAKEQVSRVLNEDSSACIAPSPPGGFCRRDDDCADGGRCFQNGDLLWCSLGCERQSDCSGLLEEARVVDVCCASTTADEAVCQINEACPG